MERWDNSEDDPPPVTDEVDAKPSSSEVSQEAQQLPPSGGGGDGDGGENGGEQSVPGPSGWIKTYHCNDVLCGRGGGTNTHMGNTHWRSLVAANKRLYLKLPKRQKQLVAQSIVKAVQSQDPPGRFLEKDREGSGFYYDIGMKKALDKTSQALREGAPKLREEIKTEEVTVQEEMHRKMHGMQRDEAAPAAGAVAAAASVAMPAPAPDMTNMGVSGVAMGAGGSAAMGMSAGMNAMATNAMNMSMNANMMAGSAGPIPAMGMPMNMPMSMPMNMNMATMLHQQEQQRQQQAFMQQQQRQQMGADLQQQLSQTAMLMQQLQMQVQNQGMQMTPEQQNVYMMLVNRHQSLINQQMAVRTAQMHNNIGNTAQQQAAIDSTTAKLLPPTSSIDSSIQVTQAAEADKTGATIEAHHEFTESIQLASDSKTNHTVLTSLGIPVQAADGERNTSSAVDRSETLGTFSLPGMKPGTTFGSISSLLADDDEIPDHIPQPLPLKFQKSLDKQQLDLKRQLEQDTAKVGTDGDDGDSAKIDGANIQSTDLQQQHQQQQLLLQKQLQQQQQQIQQQYEQAKADLQMQETKELQLRQLQQYQQQQQQQQQTQSQPATGSGAQRRLSQNDLARWNRVKAMLAKTTGGGGTKQASTSSQSATEYSNTAAGISSFNNESATKEPSNSAAAAPAAAPQAQQTSLGRDVSMMSTLSGLSGIMSIGDHGAPTFSRGDTQGNATVDMPDLGRGVSAALSEMSLSRGPSLSMPMPGTGEDGGLGMSPGSLTGFDVDDDNEHDNFHRLRTGQMMPASSLRPPLNDPSGPPMGSAGAAGGVNSAMAGNGTMQKSGLSTDERLERMYLQRGTSLAKDAFGGNNRK